MRLWKVQKLPKAGTDAFSPFRLFKLAKGEIASLSGAQDDPRYFQISVPVQPGNSGEVRSPAFRRLCRSEPPKGGTPNVVSAKLSARAALSASGALPENVNYAPSPGPSPIGWERVSAGRVRVRCLESAPEVSAKLKEPTTKAQKFEDVVKAAEQAAVLVLVYRVA